MTTSENSVNSNKAALRASLKKEDESLALRIVDTDVTELVAPPPVFTVPVESLPEEDLGLPARAEEKSSAKTKAETGRAEAQAAKARQRAKSAAKAGAANKKGRRSVAEQEETSPPVNDGKRARGKSVKAPEKRPVKTKEKREEVVHYSLDLLKSEEIVIESLRSELSKTAGWTASRSDILRAGVRLFAEQTLDRRKELLTGLTSAATDKKSGLGGARDTRSSWSVPVVARRRTRVSTSPHHLGKR